VLRLISWDLDQLEPVVARLELNRLDHDAGGA
jgi:hypothetical protein